MGGIAGFALGGLLGSMLFGGMGMGGGFGGGFGLLEMLLIGGAAFLVFRILRNRAAARTEPAYAGASAYGSRGRAGRAAAEWCGDGGSSRLIDIQRGIGHIRGMDSTFDPVGLAEWAKSTFIDVQAGLSKRDLSAVQDRLTPQQFGRLQEQFDQLRGARRTNRIERVQIGRSELTEAWQEGGQDWVTVYFTVSLVDYTVDDSTGAIVEGAASPVSIEEYLDLHTPGRPEALAAVGNPDRVTAARGAR